MQKTLEWVEKGIHRHHRVIGYKFQAAGCATSHELLAGKIPGTPKTKKAIATAVGYIPKLDCESLRLRTLHTSVARIWGNQPETELEAPPSRGTIIVLGGIIRLMGENYLQLSCSARDPANCTASMPARCPHLLVV